MSKLKRYDLMLCLAAGITCSMKGGKVFAKDANSILDKAANAVTVSVENVQDVDTEAELMFKSGGSTHTHQYIVRNAVNILKHDKGTSKVTSYLSTLLTYTDWPDVVGNETNYLTFAGHFYDPDKGTNYLGGSSPTAKSNAISYFNAAVTAYKSGNIEEAFINLGKGSHYVSDLNEPHHASNLTAVGSNHTAFEKYVDENKESVTISGNTLASSYYTTAKNTSLSTLMQQKAVYAKSLVSIAKKKATYQEATNKCLNAAMISVTQYFYKFAQTVGIYS